MEPALTELIAARHRLAAHLRELAAGSDVAVEDHIAAHLAAADAIGVLTLGVRNREEVIEALRGLLAPPRVPAAAADGGSAAAATPTLADTVVAMDLDTIDEQRRQQLRDHLAGRHGTVMDPSATEAEMLEHHIYEHTGPGGIRNHDVDDLDFDADKAAIAYGEVGDLAGRRDDTAEWEARALQLTTEIVALAASTGAASISHPFNLAVTADPPDGDADGRRFFVDADELTHGPGGLVTGIQRVRYELQLTRVGLIEAT